MTNNEVNKIISEYVGYGHEFVVIEDKYLNRGEASFTESLDALIPVWEKLNKHVIVELCRHKAEGYHCCYFRDLDNPMVDDIYEHTFDKTIQEAAAHATARAILENESHKRGVKQ